VKVVVELGGGRRRIHDRPNASNSVRLCETKTTFMEKMNLSI